MFDEYVEHSGTPSAAVLGQPSAASASRGALSNVAYEGFEGGYEEDDLTAPSPSSPPLLTLGRVQYTPPSPILSLTASPSSLHLLLYPSILLPIDLQHPEDLTPLPLPVPPAKQGQREYVASRVFADPDGRHVLVTGESGENFYFYNAPGVQDPKQRRVRPLKGIRGYITAVSFPRPFQSSSTGPAARAPVSRDVLLSLSTGQLFSVTLDPSGTSDFLSSPDKHVTLLYTIPEKQPVLGLWGEYYTDDRGRRAGVVVCCTGSRLYQFYGPMGAGAVAGSAGGGGWEDVFRGYREGAPKFLELPPPHPSTSLHVLYPSPPTNAPSSTATTGLPTRLAWLTSSGIYTSSLLFPPPAGSQGPIDNARLCPFPGGGDGAAADGEVPMGMAMTEHHFVLLYEGGLRAVSVLGEREVWAERLPLAPRERPLALAPDLLRHTCWVYTPTSLFELDNKAEDRDVWRDMLAAGKYEGALAYAKTTEQKDFILASLADSHFSAGRYIPAAQNYALSPLSRSFEEVTLKFIDANERDALRYYLANRLERTRKADVSQRMLLATWLVEFYLAKVGEVDDGVASFGKEGEGEDVHGVDGGDKLAGAANGEPADVGSRELENLLTERRLLEDELKQFLETYRANLDKKTTYELILSHGRSDVFLHYASLVGDWARVVEHWVVEEEWGKALDVLSRQNDLGLYYRHSSVLIRHAPKETVDLWLRAPALDPLRLVSALLQASAPKQGEVNHAVRYVHNLIFDKGNTDAKIHNLLITFLATLPSTLTVSAGDDPTPPELLRFLSAAPVDPLTGLPYYDLDYALRLCKTHRLTSACVLIYSQMGLYENAVELALERGDVELARINADKPEEDERLRKKLWLKIAKYVVQDKKDIRTAMQFVESTALLSLEDILPFFPDFVLIDDFKDTIISALESSSAHIEKLKSEMEDATRSAESIRAEIGQLKERFMTVERNERCARCGFGLLARQFYVFPCGHSFHTDCLIAQAKEYLPPHALRRILALQNQLMQLTQQRNALPTPGAGVGAGPGALPGGPAQRALLSAAFNPQNLSLGQVSKLANPLALGSAGKKLLTTAGEGLRDLIIPESLASAIGAWGGGGAGRRRRADGEGGQGEEEKKVERLREELDELIAAECPLCEGVVVGLDKPFVEPGEVDESWAL